jgi:hypothetical protein
MTPAEKALAADMPSVIHPHLTLDDAADFTWDWHDRYLLDTNFGYYVWYAAADDNTIRPYYGNPLDFCERGYAGKWKGNYIIRDFCGPDVRMVVE